MRTVTPQDATIGHRIRDLREQRGMTQQGLAEGIGVTFQQVQKYEKGSNRVAATRLARIARVLDAPIGALMGETLSGDHHLAQLAATPSGRQLLSYFGAMDLDDREALLRLAMKVAARSTVQ